MIYLFGNLSTLYYICIWIKIIDEKICNDNKLLFEEGGKQKLLELGKIPKVKVLLEKVGLFF